MDYSVKLVNRIFRSRKINCLTVTSCIVCPLFHLHIQGCTAESSVVCAIAKETSVCHCQPCFLFTFAALGGLKLEIPTSKFGLIPLDWEQVKFKYLSLMAHDARCQLLMGELVDQSRIV